MSGDRSPGASVEAAERDQEPEHDREGKGDDGEDDGDAGGFDEDAAVFPDDGEAVLARVGVDGLLGGQLSRLDFSVGGAGVAVEAAAEGDGGELGLAGVPDAVLAIDLFDIAGADHEHEGLVERFEQRGLALLDVDDVVATALDGLADGVERGEARRVEGGDGSIFDGGVEFPVSTSRMVSVLPS